MLAICYLFEYLLVSLIKVSKIAIFRSKFASCDSFVKPLLFVFIVWNSNAIADVEIVLKNSFIEQYKNRVTIEANFTVDKAHSSPNSVKKDADLHFAGRAPEIELPIVAEIMNAADFESAVAAVHNAEDDGEPIPVEGVWRLWCEHAGEPQTQGEDLGPFNTTNPDHVFEIHPVTKVNDENVLDSLKPIGPEFKTKDAEDAFRTYENKKSQIIPQSATTKIITPMAGYNYVEFIMQAYTDDQFVVDDGRFVYGNVQDLEGNFLAYKRRMIFVKDSGPETKVKTLRKGECLHVLGIPRFNLALTAWRAKNSATKPEALTWTLPYEIVVVGVYNDLPACSEWN